MNAKSIFKRLSRLLSSADQLPDRLTVRVAGRELQFDTRSEIAKRWFYPRYASGTPHEPPIVDWLLQRITPDTKFLDIGANVGFYTVLVSAFCPHGRVIAVDVDPRLVCEIAGNVALNGFENAEAVCGAAWDRDGDLLAFQPEQTDNLSTNRIVADQQASSISCVSFTVDSLCRQRGFQPTAAKIDVEGAEPQVLRGMQQTLNDLAVLLLEVHPDPIAARGENVDDIYSALQAARFVCWIVEDHRGQAKMRRLDAVEDWKAIKQNAMILCEKQRAAN